MDPIRNPYAPGAGTPPPELAGRDDLLATVRVALERLRLGRPTRSVVMVGLRGVGKTVLLERACQGAEEAGLQTISVELLEDRSLPAILAPALRQTLLALSNNERARDAARRGLQALAGFVGGLRVAYGSAQK